eukprot:261106_1
MGNAYVEKAELDPEYDETKHTIRIISIGIALLSNSYLLGFMTLKLIKKQKQLNVILGCAICSIVCATCASLHNLLYRFLIQIHDCRMSDIIEESIIAIARSVLLLFYVAMVTKVFQNTKQAVSDEFRDCMCLFIIAVHMVLLPSIYITRQNGTAIRTPSYGIYCRNEMEGVIAITAVVLYHIVDFAITAVLGGLFVFKLNNLLSDLKEEDDEHDNSEENVQQTKATDQLLRLIKKAMCLMFVSIISSWLLIFGGRIDKNSETLLRWIYPLDYAINGWCVFLFFDWGIQWKEFRCTCLDNATVVHNKDLEGSLVTGSQKTK